MLVTLGHLTCMCILNVCHRTCVLYFCVCPCVFVCAYESDTLFVETEGGMGRKDQKIKKRKRKGESGTTRLKLLAAHCSY